MDADVWAVLAPLRYDVARRIVQDYGTLTGRHLRTDSDCDALAAALRRRADHGRAMRSPDWPVWRDLAQLHADRCWLHEAPRSPCVATGSTDWNL